jgi:hypothetical protein
MVQVSHDPLFFLLSKGVVSLHWEIHGVCQVLQVGCPRNDQNFFSVQTETNRNSICFGCFSVCFAKPKKKFFGLFRFVSVFRTGIKTTETNKTFSKQAETNRKNPKKRTL